MSETTLLVQTCHLPHFFYVAARLRERYPDSRLEAIMVEDPQGRFYTQVFPLFDQVHYLKEGTTRALPSTSYESVVMPLLNRGYGRMKRAVRSIAARRLECDFEGEIRPLTRARLLLSLARPLHKPTPGFLAYLEKFPHRPRGEKVLLVQSCHRSLLKTCAQQLNSRLADHREVTVLRGRSLRAIRTRLKGQKFDSAVVFFSGESGYFLLKILPFFLRIPKILVVNENGHCFYASGRSLARFLYQRIRFGARLPAAATTRVVLIQTDTEAYVRHTAKRLKSKELFPQSELVVFCRPEDRAALALAPEINSLHCLPTEGWRRRVRLLRRIARLQPDVVAGIFSGRPERRPEKLLFFAIPARLRLAFNARLDCYQVSATRLLWMVRREPLVLEPETDEARLKRLEDARRRALGLRLESRGAILFIQTAEDDQALKAVERLQDPKVARPAPVLVLCRQDKKEMFEKAPGVAEVFTYDPADRVAAFRLFRRLQQRNLEVVAASFTGEPIYRVQKLLFFLLRADNRLVFNANVDCYYLTRSNFGMFFQRSQEQNPGLKISSALRIPIKAALFLPRYLFLVIWVTGRKLKRAYSLGQ